MLWNNFTKWVKTQQIDTPNPPFVPFRKVSWSGMKKAPEHMAPNSRSLKNQKLEEKKKKTEEMYSNDIQGRTKDLLEVKCVNPWFCSLQMEGKKLSDWGLPPPVIRQTQCLASDCAKPFCCRGEMTWRKVLVQEINSYLHCISHYGIRCYKQEFSS